MKAMKDLSEEEFRELYNSSGFRVKTKEELLREGWEEGGCFSLEKEGEAVDIPFEYLESPWYFDSLMEVDTSDYTFKSAPVKLPTMHGPRTGLLSWVRTSNKSGRYFKDASAETGVSVSQAPAYPTQIGSKSNAKLQ